MPGRCTERSTNADAARRLHAAAFERTGSPTGVHVDRLAVRVRRPVRRTGRDRVPAVEPRRVVGSHRRRIAPAERVDRFHPADREPLDVEAAEHREHRLSSAPRSRPSCRRAVGRRSPSTTCAACAAARGPTGHPAWYVDGRSAAVTVGTVAAKAGIRGRCVVVGARRDRTGSSSRSSSTTVDVASS